jgi:hypothetical protein
MVDTETLRNFSNWVLWIGLFLAACGTFGVNHFRGKFEREKDLIRANVERERDIVAQQKAADADRQATTLKADIARLVSDGRQLNVQLQPFLELAKRRFPELTPDQALTKLRKDLATIQNRTGAIEASLRPRALSTMDIETLSAQLRAVGSQRVRLLRNNNDEAARISADIKTLCERAGWPIENDLIDLVGNAEGMGVFRSGEQPSPACVALVLAVRGKGFAIDPIRDDTLPQGTLVVRVGSKSR